MERGFAPLLVLFAKFANLQLWFAGRGLAEIPAFRNAWGLSEGCDLRQCKRRQVSITQPLPENHAIVLNCRERHRGRFPRYERAA